MILALALIFIGCLGFRVNCDSLPVLESLFQPHKMADSSPLHPTISIHFLMFTTIVQNPREEEEHLGAKVRKKRHLD